MEKHVSINSDPTWTLWVHQKRNYSENQTILESLEMWMWHVFTALWVISHGKKNQGLFNLKIMYFVLLDCQKEIREHLGIIAEFWSPSRK